MQAEHRGLQGTDRIQSTAKMRKLDADIKAQEKASEWMHKYFQDAPVVTPDEVKIQLDPAQAEALDKATPASLREAAKRGGLGDIPGNNKEEVLQNIFKKMAQRELESRVVPKKVAPPKAPETPKPDLEESPYRRLDINALAEGLKLNSTVDRRRLNEIQDLLDGKNDRLGKNPTPSAIGNDLERSLRGVGSPGLEAVLVQQLEIDEPKKPYESDVDYQNRLRAGRTKAEALMRRQGELQKLADRLKNTRRTRKEHAPEVRTEEPKLAAPEKADIAKVAEATGIPAPQLEKKALAKKVDEAPPKPSTQQVADTVKTIDDRAELEKLLQGRTKGEIQDVAKTLGIPTTNRMTKPQLINTIGDFRYNQEHGGARVFKNFHTRAELEDMNLSDIKDIEDELGIERVSVNKGDRVNAILDAQQSVPFPGEPSGLENMTEKQAIARQGKIDKVRAAGSTLAEIQGLRSVQASPEVLKNRITGRAKVSNLPDAERDRLLAAVGNENAMDEALASIAKEHGLQQVGHIGGTMKFERGNHEPLGGADIPNGADVEVIRPGFEATINGEKIQIVKPVVDVAAPKAPVKKVAPPAAPTGPNLRALAKEKGIDTDWATADASRSVTRAQADLRTGKDPDGVAQQLRREADDLSENEGPQMNRVIRQSQEEITDGRNADVHDLRRLADALSSSKAPAKKATKRAAPGPVERSLANQEQENLQRDLSRQVAEGLKRQPKFSDKPLLENHYGVPGGDVNFHEDGAIGVALARMGEENKRLNIDGEPLANVLGKLATENVRGKISTEQMVRQLKELRDRVGDAKAKRALGQAIDKIDSPQVHIDIPSNIPNELKELLQALERNPLTRQMGSGGRESELKKVQDLALEIAKNDGKFSKARLISEIRNLLGGRHESQEGYYDLLRAVKEAIQKLGGG